MDDRAAVTETTRAPGSTGTAEANRIREWNDTDRTYPKGRCVHQLIEDQVERTPRRTALVHDDGELTYCELDRRANRVAACLRTLGVGPEKLVGVAMERSPELVVSLLGVLKAGGAYVPLDPDYPRERLRFMAEDTEAEVVLTQPSVEEHLPDTGAERVRVEDVWLEGEGEPVDDRSGECDLAYILYTSGSTGRPKGVMIEHRSIVNRLFWMQDQYEIGADDVIAQKTPFSFDVSLWELFWPPMVGARMAVARPGGHKDSSYLARLVEEAGVTVMHFVPSMLELFLEVDGLEGRCRSLRHVVCSGEALPRKAVDRFFEQMPDGVELWNLYGPTEAAVDVTYWRCDSGSDDRTVPIGRPVANTRIHVVDEDLKPRPVGAEGELLIGGVQVGRGYWKRPELTAEAFVPDPFSEDSEARAYRTGDRARWREDGVVEFLGRIDHQVKLRGQRIELGEVEAVLRARPEVLQAVVTVRENGAGEKRLVGYVVPEDGAAPEEGDFREGLAEQLPEVMVPSQVVTLDEMPLTPNGKLDRDALPDPPRTRPELDRPFLPPRTPLEERLAEMWARVLDLDRVGVRDPFFELGGTSLDAARFVNRLQDELDEFIYVVTVFDAPTVEEYADFLGRDYPDAVARRFDAGAGEDGERVDDDGGRIGEEEVERLQRAVPTYPLQDRPDPDGGNDPAIFILAPPRSGTTLLRVMLAGHPDVFAASELQLLHFETLGERRTAFTGKFSAWLEGTVRTVMELRDLDAEEAKARMAELEEKDLSTSALYRMLQEWAGGRTLVDKSPSYALDPNALTRAERDFRDPYYIQLVRHPYAMVESFVSQHMEQIVFLRDHAFDPRELGEVVWLLSHRTVEKFLGRIPPERHRTVRFEDLVTEPREVMATLCEQLGLPFDPVLLRPYEGLDEKMVDGVHDDSTPMGDTRLLEREGIDPSVAEKWRGVLDDDYLGEPTWELAGRFGYQRPEEVEAGEPEPAPRTADEGRPNRRRSLRKRRLDARQRAGRDHD